MSEDPSPNDMASIQSTLQVILTEVRGLGGRFDTLETRFDTLETRFDTLETRFDTLETRFDTLETRFDAFETRFDELEARVAKVEARLTQLSLDTAEMWREIVRRIDDRADELRRDLRTFMTDIRVDWDRALQLWSSQLDNRTLNLQGKIGDLEVRMAAVERYIQQQTPK